MRLRRFSVAICGLALSTLGMSNTANANSLRLAPTSVGVDVGSQVIGSSTYEVYKFTYNVNLSPTSSVDSSDPSMFTLFDISGFVGGSYSYTPSVGTFTLSDSALGPVYTPGSDGSTIAVADSPFRQNLTGKFVGSSVTNTSDTNELTLGSFSFLSIVQASATTKSASFDVNSDGSTSVSLESTVRPKGDLGPVGTPLPTTAFGGIALLGMIGARRSRKS